MQKRKFFILSGEASGDIHAARLMSAMKAIDPNIEFIGIGGMKMEKEGLKSIVSQKEMSVVGFWEVAKRISFFKRVLAECKELMLKENVDAFIPIDYPGFNIKLAGFAKENSIPVLYYIAPQLWAWGKNRAQKLASVVDKLLVVFPFEKEYFENFSINTEFVGHPLLDDPVFQDINYNFENREKLIAVLPGSRKQEIAKHLPLLKPIFEELHKKLPEYKIAIAKSSNIDENEYKKFVDKDYVLLKEDSRELMRSARAGIVKTGTSNLEAALCFMPFTMFYKTSALTYFWGKKLINLDWISLVNILSKRTVIKELIQNDFTSQNTVNEILEIIKNEEYRNSHISAFSDIKKYLGEKGASQNAARIILEYNS